MRRSAQGFTLIEIMVVITIIAALVSTVAVVVPKMQEKSRQLSCQNNLSQLCQIFLMEKQDSPSKAQKYSGVALWLSYRKSADQIQRGNEKVLCCPGDPAVAIPENEEDKKRWDTVDLDHPKDDLCSYAARDFKNYPLDIDSKDKQIVGCDRQGSNQHTSHHKNGIMVGYEAGDVQYVTKEELGMTTGTDEKIVVGPEATSPMLKKVAYIINKKGE